ncbi:MAG: GumC family protein [Rubripirellula sp.]
MLAFIRRQAATFVAVLLFGVFLTLLVIIFAPRKYQSEGKLLLKLGRENLAADPLVTTAGEMTQLYRTRTSEINTALQTMKSRELLETVAEEVGETSIIKGRIVAEDGGDSLLGSVKSSLLSLVPNLDPIDDREKAIIALQKNMQIEAGRDSSVVSIHYRAKSPELAQAVTSAWMRTYRVGHAKMHASPGALEFFERQEIQLVKNLDAARERLRERKTSSNLVTIEGQQAIIESQIELAKRNRIDSQSALAAAQARLSSLAKQSEDMSQTTVISEAVSDNNAASDAMRGQLYELEIEERKAAGKYSETHPRYIAIAEQLAEARKVWANQQNRSLERIEGLNPVRVTAMEQWTTELANVDARKAELAASERVLEQLRFELTALNQNEVELAKLQRSVEVLEHEYRQQFVKKEQARFAGELEKSSISNVRIVQEATLQRKPVSPNKLLCTIVGLFGSILLASGIASLREAHRELKLRQEVRPTSSPSTTTPELRVTH